MLLLGTFITDSHAVKGYYLQQQDKGICVVADADWAPDWEAFCTDSIDRALQVQKELNAGVKAK